ncbi:unnamed protein product [Pleuronectes platessa]|uniref:Uncharacterized protein n=1 Tax=Pleuronectes platessa TaxID=8262 RepID=A0A9N7UJF9_PLEPL|nr:unnamed protein product [Pleuronectes platessa]
MSRLQVNKQGQSSGIRTDQHQSRKDMTRKCLSPRGSQRGNRRDDRRGDAEPCVVPAGDSCSRGTKVLILNAALPLPLSCLSSPPPLDFFFLWIPPVPAPSLSPSRTTSGSGSETRLEPVVGFAQRKLENAGGKQMVAFVFMSEDQSFSHQKEKRVVLFSPADTDLRGISSPSPQRKGAEGERERERERETEQQDEEEEEEEEEVVQRGTQLIFWPIHRSRRSVARSPGEPACLQRRDGSWVRYRPQAACPQADRVGLQISLMKPLASSPQAGLEVLQKMVRLKCQAAFRQDPEILHSFSRGGGGMCEHKCPVSYDLPSFLDPKSAESDVWDPLLCSPIASLSREALEKLWRKSGPNSLEILSTVGSFALTFISSSLHLFISSSLAPSSLQRSFSPPSP